MMMRNSHKCFTNYNDVSTSELFFLSNNVESVLNPDDNSTKLRNRQVLKIKIVFNVHRYIEFDGTSKST